MVLSPKWFSNHTSKAQPEHSNHLQSRYPWVLLVDNSLGLVMLRHVAMVLSHWLPKKNARPTFQNQGIPCKLMGLEAPIRLIEG